MVVVEKQPQLGGTTGIAIGSFTANRTAQQRRNGIADSLDDHVADAGMFADPRIEARNNDALRRYFLAHAADTLDWLGRLGLVFHGPSPEPPNRVPRMHNAVPNAKAYIAALQSRLLRRGGRVVCGAAVNQLIRKDGRAVGVMVDCDGTNTTFHADVGVVLAAGDYANSSELIEQFKGSEFSAVDGINPNAQGDGHRLAAEAGARLVNMDVTYGPELRFPPPAAQQTNLDRWLPRSGAAAWFFRKLSAYVPRALVNAYIKRLLVTWQHPEDSLFQHGAILINQQGERFCDECKSPDRELAVARQSEKLAFVLLDQRMIDLFSTWPNFVSTAPEIAYAYVADYQRLRPDIATSAASLTEVASARNIRSSALAQTVESVNEQRLETALPPLAGDRWMLLGPLRAYFTTTEGGAAINQQFEVLDEQNQPIPGLYAVGQNGLGGQVLWGHGLHIAWALTSGRMAAEHLAAQVGANPVIT